MRISNICRIDENQSPAATIKSFILIFAMLIAFMGLVACSSSGSEGVSDAKASAKNQSGVTIKNCGRTISTNGKPKRIFVIHPTMTEALVAVGAKDQIVGQAWTKVDKVGPARQAEVSSVKSISDQIPSSEKIAELEPDLIVASGEFWFDGKRMNTLDYYAQKDIPVFINSSACKGDNGAKVSNSWDDIRDLGKLTGHPDLADKLVKQGKEDLDKVLRKTANSKKSAALIELNEKDVYAQANGLYADVLKAAGFENVFQPDIAADKKYVKISKETLLAKQPEYLLINCPSSADQVKVVESVKQLFPTAKAVQSGKVVVVPERTFLGGLGTPEGLQELVSKTS